MDGYRWTRTTLERCGSFLSGGTPSKDHPEYWGGTIPWASAKDMKSLRLWDTVDHLTQLGAASGAKTATENSILVLVRGMTLHNDVPICLAKRPMAFKQDVKAIQANPGVDSQFLLYWLLARKPSLLASVDSASHGTGRINTEVLKNIEILLPPWAEQRAIAHILGTLDDKIELNRRMNETLEAMARAIFKSWFVDFDPVRAKAEGRDPGRGEVVSNLFPASFIDSDLAESPEGWSAGTLADFARLNPESWSRTAAPEQIEYVDLANTKWGTIDSTAVYRWGKAPSRAQRVLRPGDSIVGTVRPGNGSYAFISEEGLTGSTGFAALRPRRPEFAEFVYLAATSASNIERLAHLADGAAYPAVRPEVVLATPVPRTAGALLQRFSRAVCPLMNKMAANTPQSRTLAALRETLLPKLISGELRVKDEKKITERMA